MSTSKQDKQVQNLFKVVQEKKTDIKKAEKPNWVTNCSFGYDPNSSSRKNIQVISKVEDLVDILAFLKVKEHFYTQANEALNVKVPFIWFGFKASEWEEDLKTRAIKIELTKKKAELETLESRLDKLISPELKKQLELEEITKLLDL